MRRCLHLCPQLTGPRSVFVSSLWGSGTPGNSTGRSAKRFITTSTIAILRPWQKTMRDMTAQEQVSAQVAAAALTIFQLSSQCGVAAQSLTRTLGHSFKSLRDAVLPQPKLSEYCTDSRCRSHDECQDKHDGLVLQGTEPLPASFAAIANLLTCSPVQALCNSAPIHFFMPPGNSLCHTTLSCGGKIPYHQ